MKLAQGRRQNKEEHPKTSKLLDAFRQFRRSITNIIFLILRQIDIETTHSSRREKVKTSFNLTASKCLRDLKKLFILNIAFALPKSCETFNLYVLYIYYLQSFYINTYFL